VRLQRRTRVLRDKGGFRQTLVLPEERGEIDHVQPLHEDVLAVNARTAGREPNVRFLDWDGRERARWCGDDAIEDVRATPDGTVWVSYLDESACVGATPGLAAFSAHGQRRFAYEPKIAGTDWISLSDVR
jgi:hypothetical protein